MRYVLLFCLAVTAPAMAQQLAPDDCAEIKTVYGVVPAECQTAAAPTTVSTAPTLAAPTEDMRHSNIFFRAGGTELDTAALLQIQRLSDLLNSPSMGHVCLRLIGHSDTSGSALVNKEIGAKRAAAVESRLSVLLRDPTRIEAVDSMGEDQILSGLPDTSPWQRRVALWARDCPPPHS